MNILRAGVFFAALLGVMLVVVMLGRDSESQAGRFPLPQYMQDLIAEGKLPPVPPPEVGFATWEDWYADGVKNPVRVEDLPQIPDEALPADHPARLSGHTTYGELLKAMLAEQPFDKLPSSGTDVMHEHFEEE